MTVVATVRNLLQRLADVAPVAWRQDPMFRWATIGAGITAALLVLRLVGPQVPTLQPQPTPIPPAGGPAGRAGAPPAVPPPAEVPKIAPGRPLGDVTVVPNPDADRFGTLRPVR